MEQSKLGKYTLLEHVGRGGVGSVYRARDEDDGSIVAVKIFASGPDRDTETTRRLRDREVRMLISVQHPNIVKFRESGYLDESYYYAMAFVEVSLLERMREENDYDLLDKVTILRQTTSALVAVHHQGIIHRDVKPGNILLDQDPNRAIHVRLTDFGIAKDVSEPDVVRDEMAGRIPGTLKYLSPEQTRLQNLDGRTDIFSLGVVAYELLTGHEPFHAQKPEDYIAANRRQVQMPARRRDSSIPQYLSDVLDRMLVKDPEERYDSETLLRDLELIQQHLVSGAPMVEQQTPGSMFYSPPQEAVREKPKARAALAPASWGLALAIAALGVFCTLLLWPEAGAAAGGAAPAGYSPPALPAERVELAAEAAQTGRHWQALTLLKGMDEAELDALTRARRQEALARARGALVEQSYQAAVRMLEQDRIREAAVALQRIKEFFPGMDRTRELSELVARRWRQGSPLDRLRAAIEETSPLVRERRFAEALEARRELKARAGDEPQARELIGSAIGDLLDLWARDLIQTHAEAAALEEFLRTVRKEAVPGHPSPALMGQLHVELAAAYHARRQFERALEHYGIAMEVGDAEAQRLAEQRRGDLFESLAAEPQDPAALGEELKSKGFAGRLWREGADERAGQGVADGALRLHIEQGPGRASVWRETMRPVRNRGFAVGMRYRAQLAPAGEQGAARLAVSLVDGQERRFELSFDGRSYNARLASAEDELPGGGLLRGAFGDEATAGRELTLEYDFNDGLVVVLFDGRQAARYRLTLEDCRVRISLSAEPGAAATADLSEPFCRP